MTSCSRSVFTNVAEVNIECTVSSHKYPNNHCRKGHIVTINASSTVTQSDCVVTRGLPPTFMSNKGID